MNLGGKQEYKSIHDNEDLLSEGNLCDVYRRINKLEDERDLLRKCTFEDVGVAKWEEGPMYNGHHLYAEFPMITTKGCKARPVNATPKACKNPTRG